MSSEFNALRKEHRWTWGLLSSSLPLEFRVAKMMAQRGYQYQRIIRTSAKCQVS